MSSGSIGGGNTRGDVKNQKTYKGDYAGRQAGILDQILGIYAQGQQRANAQNDLLYGGNRYGAAGKYFGARAGPGGNQGVSTAADGTQSMGFDQENATAAGDGTMPSGGATFGGPGGGEYKGSGIGSDTPFFNPDESGQEAPEGGLVGTYQDWQNNPWQTGPGGDAESDVLGSYDWMSSGQRTDPESQVYGKYGSMANDFLGAGGTPNGRGGTVEGGLNQFNTDWMRGGMNRGEQDVQGRYEGLGEQYDEFGNPTGIDAERAAGYGGIAGGPNAQERALYGDTSRFGNDPGRQQSQAESVYGQEINDPGYDEATKAALTRETTSAARAPFERSRDRILRGAAARGNVGSTQGAEVQLANQEATALGDAAAKNQIAQGQEKIRQREAGAQGMMGAQGAADTRTSTALSQRAGQNATQAQQRLAGYAGLGDTQGAMDARRRAALEGQAGVTGALQGITQTQRGYQGQGAQNQSNLAALAQGARQAGLAGQAGQNQALRNQQLQGAQGKEGMFNTMFGRRQAGAGGLQGLYNAGQQQRAGDLAGIGNVGGKTAEDYVSSGNWGGSL
jgi:hypothetical protein